MANQTGLTRDARRGRRGWAAVVIAALIPVAIGVIAALASPPLEASGFGSYLSSPGAPSGALSSCVLCHGGYPSTYVWNSYGTAFGANGHANPSATTPPSTVPPPMATSTPVPPVTQCAAAADGHEHPTHIGASRGCAGFICASARRPSPGKSRRWR